MKKNTSYIDFILILLIPMWCIIPFILAIFVTIFNRNLSTPLHTLFNEFYIFLPIFLVLALGAFFLGKTNNKTYLILKNIVLFLLFSVIIASLSLFFYTACSANISTGAIELIIILHQTCGIMTALSILCYWIISFRSRIKHRR